ncbi:MAG: hypothetical protein ACTH31_04325 [Pseudoclavibacter sp.]
MQRGGPRTALVRAGFAEPSTAETALEEVADALGRDVEALIELFDRRIADPDLAVEHLARILRDGGGEARAAFADLEIVRTALVVLGASSGIGEFAHRHPR